MYSVSVCVCGLVQLGPLFLKQCCDRGGFACDMAKKFFSTVPSLLVCRCYIGETESHLVLQHQLVFLLFEL